MLVVGPGAKHRLVQREFHRALPSPLRARGLRGPHTPTTQESSKVTSRRRAVDRRWGRYGSEEVFRLVVLQQLLLLLMLPLLHLLTHMLLIGVLLLLHAMLLRMLLRKAASSAGAGVFPEPMRRILAGEEVPVTATDARSTSS